MIVDSWLTDKTGNMDACLFFFSSSLSIRSVHCLGCFHLHMVHVVSFLMSVRLAFKHDAYLVHLNEYVTVNVGGATCTRPNGTCVHLFFLIQAFQPINLIEC